jgi:hypothetical protein
MAQQTQALLAVHHDRPAPRRVAFCARQQDRQFVVRKSVSRNSKKQCENETPHTISIP